VTSTPVAIFLFRRPAAVRALMERVAAARPATLFLLADGPRIGHPDDAEQCRAAREEVFKNLTWHCEVVRKFSDVNLGCNANIVGGCNYIFSQVERAIILEDDCIPEVSFFSYCEELLDRYSESGQVMHICGYNPLACWKGDGNSYLFSHECQFAWGWASWRRSWRFYDDAMTSWSQHRASGTNRPPWFNQEVSDFFNSFGPSLPETWDYRLAYAILANSGVSIVPKRNMVANVGHGTYGTHSTTYQPPEPTWPLLTPLRHPPSIVVDRDFDICFRNKFSRKVRHRLRRRIGSIMRRLLRPVAPTDQT
jgi:hypothetical protein